LYKLKMEFKSTHLILSAILILSVFVQQGLSIKCFQCNTEDDGAACPGETGGQFDKECAANATMCLKVEQEMNINKEDTTRSLYMCAVKASGEVNGDCLERTGTYRFKSWYCNCDSDSCNSATSAAVSVLLLSLAALFTRL